MGRSSSSSGSSSLIAAAAPATRCCRRGTMDQQTDECVAEGAGAMASSTTNVGDTATKQHTSGSIAQAAKPQAPSNNTRPLCRIYSHGRVCYYGNQCKFLHQRAKPQEDPSNGSECQQSPVSGTGSGGQNKGSQKSTEEVRAVREEQAPTKNLKTGSSGKTQLKQKKTNRLCKYYLAGFCALEKRCRFLHPKTGLPPVDDNDTSHTTAHETPPAAPDILVNTSEGNGVKSSRNTGEDIEPSNVALAEGQNTQATRSVAVRPAIVREEVKLSELTDEMATELRETEIAQLKKRFPSEKLIVQESEDGKLTYYRFTVNPTDPDWPFDLRDLEVMVSFPDSYPREILNIDIPADQDLPTTMGRHVLRTSQEWLQAKQATNQLLGKVELLFRPYLRWLDRNMERLFTEGARLLKREVEAERAGMQLIPFHHLRPAAESELGTSPDTGERHPPNALKTQGDEGGSSSDHSCADESDSAEDSDSDEPDGKNDGGIEQHVEGDQPEGVEASEPNVHCDIDTPRRGTEVKLINLKLGEETATLVAQKITVSLQCTRCKTTEELVLTNKHVYVLSCQKCSSDMTAALRLCMMHHHSAVLGFMDVNGCAPFDLILQDSRFLLACMNCSEQQPLEGLMYGLNKEVNCQSCHKKLSVFIETTRFHALQPSLQDEGNQIVVNLKKKKLAKDPAIQPGKPLPEFGACKHFKKSSRWLRFPCCGRAYPCDLCHNEDQTHQMEFATRMICGFCAHEQPYTNNRPCSACASALTKNSKSHHWEGGQGCRNKVNMSRKDKQKYASTNKTISRKSHAEKSIK
ncbi:uncharacterized protein LOC116939099 isoform X2 [Petromyzon marinus]|uniref:uncharacterized protein LOC116939099 isoform X2 n=1 Tax=Petromyzon marinus TaxID=7757 RepID=UPI003F72F704